MKKISAWGFAAGPFIGAALSLISLPFSAWFFSVEDIGRLTMLNFGLSLSAAIFTLQMNQGYVREFHEAKDKSQLFWAACTPGLLLFLLITAVYAGTPISISKILFGYDSEIISILFIFSALAVYASVFFTHALRMEERGVAFAISTILPRLSFMLLIASVVILEMDKNFVTLILLNTTSIVVTFIVFLIATQKSWMPALGKKIDFRLQKRMLVFSTPLVAGGLAYWGLTMLDRLLLRQYSDFEQLGIYAMASSLASVVMVVSSSFSNIWHPTVYKWVSIGLPIEKIQAINSRMLVLVVIIWCAFGLASPFIVMLLPEKYIAAQYLLPACAGAPIFYLMSEVTGIGIGIQRKSNYSMLASVAALFVSLSLNILLIPEYGAKAAAAVLMIAFYVFFIVRTEASNFLWKRMNCKPAYFYLTLCSIISIFCMLNSPYSNRSTVSLAWILLLVFTSVKEWGNITGGIYSLKRFFYDADNL